MGKAKPTRQTKMIGLRVAADLYELIERGAEGEGVSATAFTRLTLARELNYAEPVPETKARKRCTRKPLSKDLAAAMKFLGLLIDAKMALSFVARNLGEQTTFGSINREYLCEQGKLIERAAADLEAIRSRLLGDGR